MKRRRVTGAIASSAHPRKAAIIQVDGSVYKVQKRKLTKVKTETNLTGGSKIGTANTGLNTVTPNAGGLTLSPHVIPKATRHPSKYSSTRYRRRSHSDSTLKGTKPSTRFRRSHWKEESTAAASSKKSSKTKKHCLYFSRFGKCAKIDSCPFIHDPSRVAVCTRFLRGTCAVSGCPFSHKVAPEKLPVCSFFLRGNCNRNPCPYPHVRVSDDAEICPDFALEGFCGFGANCKKRHVVDCGQKYQVLCKLGKKCKTHGDVKQTRGISKKSLKQSKSDLAHDEEGINLNSCNEMVILLRDSTSDELTEDEDKEFRGMGEEVGDAERFGRMADGNGSIEEKSGGKVRGDQTSDDWDAFSSANKVLLEIAMDEKAALGEAGITASLVEVGERAKLVDADEGEIDGEKSLVGVDERAELVDAVEGEIDCDGEKSVEAEIVGECKDADVVFEKADIEEAEKTDIDKVAEKAGDEDAASEVKPKCCIWHELASSAVD